MGGLIPGPGSGSSSGTDPDADETLTGPLFTYTGDKITRIDYDNGSYKTLSYTGDKLTQMIVFYISGTTIQKDFNYSGETLLSIDETSI